jgi:hypothetical protein
MHESLKSECQGERGFNPTSSNDILLIPDGLISVEENPGTIPNPKIKDTTNNLNNTLNIASPQ